jgi:hypothetical protein
MPSSMDDASRADAPRGGPPGLGYETRDANTGAVLGFLAFLFLVLTLILFGTWRLFRHFSVAGQQPAPASVFADVRQIPSGPELEVNAREDLLKAYAKQQQELETYSWEDRKAGKVRIPIERAMDMLLQEGLPVLQSGTKDKATLGGSMPKDSNASAAAPGTARQDSPRGND